jgi:hypothetical protein
VIDQAWSPDALATLAHEERLEDALLAPDRAVETRNAAILDTEHTASVLAGRDLVFDANRQIRGGEICRAYDTEGTFLAVLVGRESGAWHPSKVLAAG